MSRRSKLNMNKEDYNEFLQNIKTSYRIIDYAPLLGYHVIKKSPRYYSLDEHDSVVIDSYKNCFWRNSDPDKKARGSIIDFIMYFNEISFQEAVDLLAGSEPCSNYESYEQDIIPSSFQLPEKDNSRKNVYAYLCKSRCIDVDIVNYFFDQKLLYQDIRKNCVFVSYRDKIAVFACLHGTNTYTRYVGDVSGSDYNWCYFINHNSRCLVITESVIDAMSYMCMHTKNHAQYDYLALASTEKYQAAAFHIQDKNNRYSEIILALDNDAAGTKATEILAGNIQKLYQDKSIDIKITINVPLNKDWNEDLIERRNNI